MARRQVDQRRLVSRVCRDHQLQAKADVALRVRPVAFHASTAEQLELDCALA